MECRLIFKIEFSVYNYFETGEPFCKTIILCYWRGQLQNKYRYYLITFYWTVNFKVTIRPEFPGTVRDIRFHFLQHVLFFGFVKFWYGHFVLIATRISHLPFLVNLRLFEIFFVILFIHSQVSLYIKKENYSRSSKYFFLIKLMNYKQYK